MLFTIYEGISKRKENLLLRFATISLNTLIFLFILRVCGL